MTPLPDFTRIFDILAFQLRRYPQQRAFNTRVGGNWAGTSIQTIASRCDRVCELLINKGLAKGDRVAIIPFGGTTDWVVVDLACQMTGLVVVPIHPTSSVADLEFILRETDIRMVIAADRALFDKVTSLKPALPSLAFLYHLGEGSDRFPFPEIVATAPPVERVEERKRSVLQRDVALIMYTSGTTGGIKGAVLTHENIVSSIKSILPILPLEPTHRVLSFLPISHIFERTSCYAYIAFGVEVYFSGSRDELPADFLSVRPHLFTSVPRVLEKMYDVLHERRLSGGKLTRLLIGWAVGVGQRYKDRTKMGVLFGVTLFFARLLVLDVWRRRLGGSIRYIAVGAAALRPEISRLFSAGRIRVLTGYGMTETSPFISVNRPGMNRFGTVGVPVPGVEVIIDAADENGEGEILVRGPNVMKGYYQRPELNAQVLTCDGWLRTGDIGKIIERKFLVITDRKKDIFKTSAGKYISPQQLENHFVASPFIFQCMIIGFNRPFVTAIIVPSFSLLQRWCEENGVHWTSPKYMVHNIKIVQLIEGEVQKLNEGLQGYQRVRNFILSDEEWTAENKELSVSQKLLRDKLHETFKKEVNKMYETSES